MRSEAFAERRSLAFGVREAFARPSGRAFERQALRTCVREAGAFGSVRRRSEAFKGIRQRLACQRFLMAWAGHGMTR